MRKPNRFLVADGDIEISPGDLLWLNSYPHGVNHGLAVMAVLYIGQKQNVSKVVFYSFGISRHERIIEKEGNLWKVRLPGQRSSTIIRENHILKAIKAMRNDTAGYAKYKGNKHAYMHGEPLIIISTKMQKMSFKHIGVRIADIVNWPRNALHLWACLMLSLGEAQMRNLATITNNKEFIFDAMRSYVQKPRGKPKRINPPAKMPREPGELETQRYGLFKGIPCVHFTARETRNLPLIETDFPVHIKPGSVIIIADVPKYIIMDSTQAVNAYETRITISIVNNSSRINSHYDIPVISYSSRSMAWAIDHNESMHRESVEVFGDEPYDVEIPQPTTLSAHGSLEPEMSAKYKQWRQDMRKSPNDACAWGRPRSEEDGGDENE